MVLSILEHPQQPLQFRELLFGRHVGDPSS
jgi:hypothetical protein